MNAEAPLTVGALARMAGLTVRTLHHYDEIGLVVPGERTAAGYRLYGQDEVERLQEVLFFRVLGFGLAAIKEAVTQPDYDRAEALKRQRSLLTAKADRIAALVTAIDNELEARRNGMKLSKQEMLEIFGNFDPTEHEAEAEARWGDSAAYRQSAARTKRYTKADWQALEAEAAGINDAFLALMAGGVAPDTEAAMNVAEQHRTHISRWFYDCPRRMHAGLGQMYVTDVRFTESIDRAGAGLAEYMSQAIQANAGRG